MLSSILALGFIAGVATAVVLVKPHQRLDIIGLAGATGMVGWGISSIVLAICQSVVHSYDATPVAPLVWALLFAVVFAGCVRLTTTQKPVHIN